MSDRRLERLWSRVDDKTGDFRNDFERDCDRILYSGAFRRLAVITQVVSPAGGHAFHNRLTHALKVAQVGRRIAEGLNTSENAGIISSLGGLHPSVVEAAGLAHDLGHPPFGHIAEEELDERLRKADEKEGYEGNAQSFRIVSCLEIRESGRNEGALGLNLTRATLNALLKYPKMRDLSKNGHQKFGAYRSEDLQFRFARQYSSDQNPCLEAQIMDWADDISYAVHDLEDFYRAGMIPLDRLSKSNDEIKGFLDGMLSRVKIKEGEDERDYEETAAWFLAFCPVSEAYSGRRTQRAALRGLASSIIHRAVSGTKVSSTGLVRPPKIDREVTVLKQLTWHYVIEDSRLTSGQYGKRKVIGTLFDI
ncbi:MAG TPA: dNTP triphosphohydrolase, partial [Terrimicrobiaceae bacterium]